MIKQIFYISVLLLHFAFGNAQTNVRPGESSVLLKNTDGNNNHLKAVGRLVRRSRCTGTFINTSNNDNAPAYVITCGHCVQDWNPNKVFYNEPLNGYKMVFNYFIDTQNAQDSVQVKQIVYSTMGGKDIAILELNATVGQLKNRGIQPISISTKEIKVNTPVTMIGAPAGPLPKELIFIRQSNGLLKSRVNLLEYQWNFSNTYKTDLPDVYGGASGSPLFRGNDYSTMYAVVSTTTIDGEEPCYMGCPCEIKTNELTVSKNTSYAIPVNKVGNCFTKEGLFDVNQKGCPLNKGNQLVPVNFPANAMRSTMAQPAKWNIKFEGSQTYYRYKAGLASITDCNSSENYSSIKNKFTDSVITDIIGTAEGMYCLCIQSGDASSVNKTWKTGSYTAKVLAKIDNTASTDQPEVNISETADEYIIQPVVNMPHHTFLFYSVLINETLDNAVFEKYQWKPVKLLKKDGPYKIVIKATDDAGNEAPLKEIVLNK